MPEIVDDKSEHCIPFIVEHIKQHRQQYEDRGESPTPFFVGLNGVQGAGKTTLRARNPGPVALGQPTCSTPRPAINPRRRTWCAAIRRSCEERDEYQASKLRQIRLLRLWRQATRKRVGAVNAEGKPAVEVIVFEGWCVGFRSLDDEEAERKWRAAKAEYESKGAEYQGQLGKLQLQSVLFVNAKLREYDALTDRFGAFVHIDAEDTQYVYAWRLEQEAALRATRGTGMTEEQVVRFVNGYYPAYELYTDRLRNGIFGDEKDKQLRLVVGKDRKVKGVVKI
ncbi:hypothetical protein LTR82_003293 [Friedmanniomyces endolithicus]|uniref:Uridine/cytidine kinase n=1 Tax=Friedmanniomyces endolithicus TaxID=329885 RepID=A0AAN6FWK3_9PEZI|nr:hypothetical protein LTR82_003293 [Friedmanniomyces endolithicus]